jgi:2-polyprenyl-3-methyl-5-hydroxy-6-metoxy-1,4-benzoquinol methylase
VRPYPEFEEYFVRYPVKRSLYSAHYYAFRLVGKNQRVLELRCGDGAFGAELVRVGNSVVGLDPEPKVPVTAGFEDVIRADLEEGLARLAHNSAQQFDRILMLDILEHLREPVNILELAKALLAPRGKLIVSVPNAVNLTVRAMVMFGRFRYSDRGILDWSHLRFFTAESIMDLLRKQGYRITARHYTVIPLERVIPMRSDSRLLRLGGRVLRVITALAPDLFAYEIVLAAERA